jgi:hypothetical protein
MGFSFNSAIGLKIHILIIEHRTHQRLQIYKDF